MSQDNLQELAEPLEPIQPEQVPPPQEDCVYVNRAIKAAVLSLYGAAVVLSFMARHNKAISPCSSLICATIGTAIDAARLVAPMIGAESISFGTKVRLGVTTLAFVGFSVLASKCDEQENYDDSGQEQLSSFTFGAGR